MLTQMSSMVVGLDNHGYNFPGALTRFARDAPDTPLFAFYDSLAVHPDWCDERFSFIDVDENSFFHSSEPASLVALLTGKSKLKVYWHADSRENPAAHIASCADRHRYRTVGYVLEAAASSAGPYRVLAEIPANNSTIASSPIYSWRGSSGKNRRYFRVSSRLSDGRIIPYSWPVPRRRTHAAVLSLVLHPSGEGLVEFEALVRAKELPPRDQLILERQDRYEKRRFDPIASAGSVKPISGKLAVYSGTAALHRGSYVRIRFGSVTYPSDSDSVLYAADAGHKNNRSLTSYGSMAIRPTSAVLRQLLADRARAAITAGADGLFLDFVHDNVGRLYNGGRVGNLRVPVSASEEARYGPGFRDAAAALLEDLQATVPEASIVFNGLYVPSTTQSAREVYLPRTAGIFVEYFAFDNHGRDLDHWIPESFDAIITHSHQAAEDSSDTSREKLSLLATRGGADEVDKRRIGLGLYLLVSHPNVFWQYSTADYYTDVTWLPEFSLPLGQPLIPSLDGYSDLFHQPGTDSILRREFENGLVLYNHSSSAHTIYLREPLHPVLIQPGLDPLLGGTGSYAVGIAVTRIEIASKDAVILLRNP